jgi:hypothetical protein
MIVPILATDSRIATCGMRQETSRLNAMIVAGVHQQTEFNQTQNRVVLLTGGSKVRILLGDAGDHRDFAWQHCWQAGRSHGRMWEEMGPHRRTGPGHGGPMGPGHHGGKGP